MEPDSLFVGRDSARRQLTRLVAHTDRRGGSAVIVGEPGIGKTALLTHVAGPAGRQHEGRVIWVRGTEGESVIAYACAADLLTPFRDHFAALPPAQRRALDVALAFTDGEPGNALAVFAGALGALASAGDREPLVIVVDDLQWVDPESRRMLLFIARRLETEHVVLLLGLRDEPGVEPWLLDLPTIRLGGLSLRECAGVVRRRGLRASPGRLRQVVGSSGGNPLAVIETLEQPAPPAGPDTPGGGLTLGATIQRAWRTALGRLDERGRRALFVLAVARWPGLPDLADLLAALGLSLDDLVLAEQQHLAQFDQHAVHLRHPLLRQVVIDATPVAYRMPVYRTLAGLATAEQRAWYLSAAAFEPDDEVAAELDDAAAAARARGGYSSAAQLLHRAAELTVPAGRRAQRRLAAANDFLLAGDAARAEEAATDAAALDQDPGLLSAAAVIRSIALCWMGDAARAYDRLSRLAQALETREPLLAAGLWSAAAMPAGFLGDAHRCIRAAEEGDALLVAAGAAPGFADLAMSASALAMTGQISAARDRLSRARTLIPGIDLIRQQQHFHSLAMCHLWTEQNDLARGLVNEGIDVARTSGAPHALAYALNVRAEAETRSGRWTSAGADAAEALCWAEELQQHSMIGFSLVTLGRLEAARGQRADAEARIDRVRREIGPFHIDCLLVYEPAVLGLAALSDGDPDAAADVLEQAWARATQIGLTNPAVVPFVPDLAEAHVRCGRTERAREVVAWLLERAEATGLRYPLLGAKRCEGLMAREPHSAAAAFAVAEAEARLLGQPFELGRVLLCAGEVMRRGRQPVAARPMLAEARRLFDGMGAVPWAEMAARELSATGLGVAVADRRTGELPGLTPQEVQVARIIAAGKNNLEVAAALFVSRKTVEAHLTRIYRKLEVRSRSELTALVLRSGLDS